MDAQASMRRGFGVTVWLREALPEWTTLPFWLTSMLGDLALIVPLVGLLYARDVLGTLRRGDSPDEPLCSDGTAFVIAAVTGGLALIVLLEAVIAAPRPPEELHAVDASPYGFPSGHAMAATVVWGGLATWYAVGRPAHRYAAAGTIVALVAVSRLALGVHYLADVIAAVVLGAAWIALVSALALDRPDRAFAVAIAVAIGAVVVTGGSSRAVVAAAGTVAALVGWRTFELEPVRRRLLAVSTRARERVTAESKA